MDGIDLFACGSNGSAQLAIGHSDDVSVLTPCRIHPSSSPSSSGYTVFDLVSASTHALALVSTTQSSQGSTNVLLGTGTNTSGQMGARCALWDDTKPQTRFKPVDLSSELEGVWEPVKIATTWTTSFVVYEKVSQTPSNDTESSDITGASGSSNLKPELGEQPPIHTEQRIVSAGSNDFGELGGPSPSHSATSRATPSTPSARPTTVNIGLLPGERVDLIRGGQRHVVVLVSHGETGKQRLIGWGASRKGELDPASATQAQGGKGKGKAAAYSIYLPPTEMQLPDLGEAVITDIALGASHTLVLLSDGRVLAWGSDLKGQITGLESVRGVRQIAATWGGSYLLMEDGRVVSQGSDTHGQLLSPTGTGTTRGDEGADGAKEVTLAPGLRVKRIAAGSEHLLILAQTDDGRSGLWAGGWNEHGNLGLGDSVDRRLLTQVAVDGEVTGLWAGCAATWVRVE